MPNLKVKIDGDNIKTLENIQLLKAKSCNCLKKENSPIRGAYLTENILHYFKMYCDEKKYKLILC